MIDVNCNTIINCNNNIEADSFFSLCSLLFISTINKWHEWKNKYKIRSSHLHVIITLKFQPLSFLCVTLFKRLFTRFRLRYAMDFGGWNALFTGLHVFFSKWMPFQVCNIYIKHAWSIAILMINFYVKRVTYYSPLR